MKYIPAVKSPGRLSCDYDMKTTNDFPVIIGISGGTGAGKTTLCRKICDHFNSDISLLWQDSYYRDLEHLPLEERERQNFDHPDAIDNDLFCEHLMSLKQRKPINVPEYDFTTHTRSDTVRPLHPQKIVVVEGMLLFADSRIRNLCDCKIYLELDLGIRFIRRLRRDIEERGRTVDSVITQYLDTVRPMHLEFVRPAKAHADIIINGMETDLAFEAVINW